MQRRENPRKELIWRLHKPRLPMRGWTRTKDRTHADLTMADTSVLRRPSVAAGPSPPRQPERRQLTHDHDQEVAYRQCGHQGHPPPTQGKGSTNPTRPQTTGGPNTPFAMA
jgi:hypothetical protein